MSEWLESYEVIFDDRPEGELASANPIYQTRLGSAFCGDSLKLLKSDSFRSYQSSIQLVFTSPPFPLNKKKKYGNLKGEEYLEWFAQFGPLLRNAVKADGSIVIEIGNAWEPGRPVMSTLVLKALLRFLESAELHLCQEFVWYNPARLPSPIQWVNIDRCRVKDAFTRIWWMSPSERPKADNRRILREYSASMKKLVQGGKYNSGKRPSQHRIGKNSFNKNNEGAIPPNVLDGDYVESLGTLLKGTNTHSWDDYQRFCRQHEIDQHPARMPPELVTFFMNFLTDEDDIVLDPFAGSNTTGAIAESLDRRWLSCEANWTYAASSISRFTPDKLTAMSDRIIVHRSNQSSSSSSSSLRPVLTS